MTTRTVPGSRATPVAAALALALPLACAETPSGPASPDAVSGSRSATVVQVDPPGSGDFTTLQSAIDDNPGAVLQLQAGTYDIGAERLTIPHGLTLRGATDAAGELLTTIEGENPEAVVHVRALDERADEEIVLRELAIVSSEASGVLHSAFDFEAGEFVLPGGGDLTIQGCDIRQEAISGVAGPALWVNVVDGVAIEVENSTFTSNFDGSIILDGAVYTSLQIRNNEIRYLNAGILVNGQEFRFLDEQDPSATGRARIVGNDIQGGTVPSGDPVSVGLSILVPRGPVFAADNSLSILGTDPPNTLAFGVLVDNPLGNQVAITNTELAGGDSDDGKVRIGLSVSGDEGRYARNTFRGFWSTGVVVALPILPFLTESSQNKFLHNDFSEARIAPADQPELPPFPAVHWWLAPESTENSVTDNSGVEQLILDQGVDNHFQGTSFLPAAADG